MSKIIKFKFDPNQEHQRIAITSVVKLFDGFSQELITHNLFTELVPNIGVYEDFDSMWLLGNLNDVQYQNNLFKSPNLVYDDGIMLEGVSPDSHCFPCFTIEMETGTGKTYAYLRTIYELKNNYGFRKFIIVVPSVAIYEGIIKAFEITKEHFKTLYGNETTVLIKYDGQNISCVKNFAVSPYITIMVITIDSFNKSANKIYKVTEKLPGGKKPYEYIQETRPILILDEPQNYLSVKSREALRTFKPLFGLNYSATPVEKPNPIYKLTPVDAFKRNLVKKIQVEGVTEEQNVNDKNLSLMIESIYRDSSGINATVKAYVNKNGTIVQKTINLKKGDDLYQKTNNPDFEGFIVDELNIQTNEITFTNSSVLSSEGRQSITLSKQEIFRVQIEQAIKYHFTRQQLLRDKGIKVLTLFFIDRVDNYVQENGIIKILFDNAFNKLKHSDPEFAKFEPHQVREGYFAKKKDKKGHYIFIDTPVLEKSKKEDDKKAEKEAYELIMKKKEQLLSFSEKVSFIFAHSALREGWDNPNVFQICTLNTTKSETKKRQEIGRGLRLCVNQDGERVIDEGVNVLTIVANESYEEYCSNLQQNYTETGDVDPPKPTNARRKQVERNDDVFSRQEFKKFWNELMQKTEYIIKVNTNKLITQCIDNLNRIEDFPKTQIVITRGEFIISQFNIKLIKVLNNSSAQIEVSISDTSGQTSKLINTYKIGDDISRRLKDKRLSGYKIVEIEEKGLDSTVKFGNGTDLTYNSEIHFDSEKGQNIERITENRSKNIYPVFNLIDRTYKEVGLTRATIIKIFKGIKGEKKTNIFNNPEGFASIFITKIRETLANHIAENIEYRLNGQTATLNLEELFPKNKEFAQKEIIEASENSLYNQIQIDSDVEKNFVNNRLIADDRKGNILAYFKFPPGFKIKMPKIIGNYNPDWGIIRKLQAEDTGQLNMFLKEDKGTYNVNKNKNIMNLVRETKGSVDPNLLQYPNEKRKIDCAKKHFNTLQISYRQVTDHITDWWES